MKKREWKRERNLRIAIIVVELLNLGFALARLVLIIAQ